MKKLFGIFTAAVLSVMLMVGSSYACHGPNCPKTAAEATGTSGLGIGYDHGDVNTGGYSGAWSDNSYEARTHNDCGTSTAWGKTTANGTTTGASGNLGGVAGLSHSRADVNSMAMTLTCPGGMNVSRVSGGVDQGNWATAEHMNNGGSAYAVGGNTSMGTYEGTSRGRWGSAVFGGASTCGLTGTIALTGGNTSFAAGLTGNTTSAYQTGCGHVHVAGSGEMYTGTYAQNPSGWAGTTSYSAFQYSNNGRHHVSGSGVAAGVGYSHVNNLPNGVTAGACTTSYSHAR